jgi:hypothetical protein
MMVTVRARRVAAAAILGFLGAVGGCSREQQDWRAAETRDTLQAYGQFIEHHPDSELVRQARTRMAQLGEDHDWALAGKIDTAAGYQQFLAEHPGGKWAQEARIRAQSFSLGAAPATRPSATQAAIQAAAQTATQVAKPSAGAAATSDAAGSAASSTPPAASPSLPTPPPTKGYGIQLGAFTSVERANTEWRALEGRYAAQLHGLAPLIVAADTASGRVFRLQAETADEARARLICDDLRQRSQQCVPVVPH